MRTLELVVYEHPSVPAGEARLFHRPDDPALPQGLRGRARVPCVVTGDISRLGETLTLLRLAELWGAASLNRRGKGARV